MNAHNPEVAERVEQAALRYAERGWCVFPVPEGRKKSHKSAKHCGGRRWGNTTDPVAISADWKRWPAANVGIACGTESGLFVVEADSVQGHGVDGVGAFEALCKEHGGLPTTIEAESPSGSIHFYFRWPKDVAINNSVGQVAPGVDVRGDGGMVVAPPSVKPGGGAYRWRKPPGLFELADCPEWLLELCRKPKPPVKAAPHAHGAPDAWTNTALGQELARVLSASSGERNATLNSAAFKLGQIVGGGGLSEEAVVAELQNAGLQSGLEVIEVLPTIMSGLRAGMAQPRGPKAGLTLGLSGRAPTTTPTLNGSSQSNESGSFDLSHDALAIEMERAGWAQDARHVAAWGQWLFWTGTHWRRDERLDHMTRTRAFLGRKAGDLIAWAEQKVGAADADKEGDKLRAWAKDQARVLRSRNTVSAVESLARSNAALVAAGEDFDADQMLLGTPGGTVDLRTGQLRPAKRSDMLTRQTAVAPADGQPMRWLQFLSEIFDGDREIIAFLQRAAGYALTGETREHRLLFL